ncbi:hypothetical protein SAMN05192569_1001404 [Parageobacillus thermantarcticus]|uniref:40-residue YVTN family beta-propeller repeat-containing protein n=1 Tax=Parageobacillus thermantarcticus TaxID=186116 RepID=A0A1I0SM16_9BACL|nr:hypothetical protein SAMN05192569_1001404 [Parageobacillus thermantarcticus]
MKKWLWLCMLLVLLVMGGCQISPAFDAKTKTIRHEPVHSDNIAINKKGDTLYIANIDINSVTIFNTKTKRRKRKSESAKSQGSSL